MTLLDTKRALVIAPHPDDEVLGCGGSIARLAESGAHVEVGIVTRGYPPRFDEVSTRRVRTEALQAHAILGVTRTVFLDMPAAEVDRIPQADVISKLSRLVHEAAPDTLFIPFLGDLHLDHQIIFFAAMVAARPSRPNYPRRLIAYETLSETNWNAPYLTPAFSPNVFVDIGRTLERKLQAMQAYGSQLKAPPHERSIEALRALAKLRGATVNRTAAEAYVLLREVM